MEESLRDYNIIHRGQRLDLVVFNYAIEHMTRIGRILRRPYGNALLVGTGGSGRQSLTRLTAAMCELEVFQIEPTMVRKEKSLLCYES